MKRLNFSAARRVFAHAIATMHADRLKRLGPTSPAYHAYHVARMKGDWKAYGAAFDAFTRADHAANDADLEAVVAAEMMERKNERQAADSRARSVEDAEDTRIAALPTGARCRARFGQTVKFLPLLIVSVAILYVLTHSLWWFRILLFLMIGGMGALVVNWRETLVILKALPAACRALGSGAKDGAQ